MFRTREPGLGALACGPLAIRLSTFECYLKRALQSRCRVPGRLGAAIRYAALGPGKRVRPLLALTACEAVGGRWRAALPAAAALECVHAFSLAHDDLPAMDDDDYRRGRLTTHRRFGEALGILAGDALLAFAFEELMRLARTGVPACRVIEAARRLAHASGGGELVGGQALDIEAEGRTARRAAVRAIHARKTGALIGASMALGALAGGADDLLVRRTRARRADARIGVPDPRRPAQRGLHAAPARQALRHRRRARQGHLPARGGKAGRGPRGGRAGAPRATPDRAARTQGAKPVPPDRSSGEPGTLSGARSSRLRGGGRLRMVLAAIFWPDSR